MFLLAGSVSSVVYVNIIYTFTVSFGDVGKAICVVLLVMQVAGSGGTFPIEVAPGNLPEDLSVSSIYAQYDSYAGMCCRILSVYVLGRIGNHVSVPSGIPVFGTGASKTGDSPERIVYRKTGRYKIDVILSK